MILAVEVNMCDMAVIPTSASSSVAVQYKASVTQTVVCSRQIVAQLLTVVTSSAAFVNV